MERQGALAPGTVLPALFVGAAGAGTAGAGTAGTGQPRPRPQLMEAGADVSQEVRQVQWAKKVLQQPGGRSAGAKRSTEGFDRILSPKQLGIPEMDPETFVSDVLLPRVPRSAGKQFIIDVGANKGKFAKSIAKWRQDGICFEPTPSVCKILKSNVAKMLSKRLAKPGLGTSDIRVLCAAVGAKASNVSFAMDASADVSFHITVPMVALDDVVPQDRHILLLKTETQGFEMGVLQGAEKLLRQRRPQLLIVEMSYGLLDRAGTSPLKLMQMIDSYGYVCTQTQFFTRPKSTDKTHKGRNPLTRKGLGHDESVTFQEMHDRLKPLPPHHIPGWTDLLCWPSDVSPYVSLPASEAASSRRRGPVRPPTLSPRDRQVAAELRGELAEEGLVPDTAEAAEVFTMRVQALGACSVLLCFGILCLRRRCCKERLLPYLVIEDRP